MLRERLFFRSGVASHRNHRQFLMAAGSLRRYDSAILRMPRDSLLSLHQFSSVLELAFSDSLCSDSKLNIFHWSDSVHNSLFKPSLKPSQTESENSNISGEQRLLSEKQQLFRTWPRARMANTTG